MAHTSSNTEQSHGVGHIVPFKILVATGVALLILTWLTVMATKINLGDGNIYLALGIAVVKGSLVALFFMHLRWDRPFNAFIFITAISFVALFISFALSDTLEYGPSIDEYHLVELQGKDAKAPQERITQTMQEQ